MAFKSFLPVVFAALLMIPASLTAPPAMAQILNEKAAATDEGSVAAKPADMLGRNTPRGTFKGFLKAVAEEKYDQAAEYLNLDGLSKAQRARGAAVAQQLQALLDRQGMLQADSQLNDDAEGNPDDDLGSNLDLVASLRVDGNVVPITVERVTTAEGSQIWLLSSDFVKQIPKLSENIKAALVDKIPMGKMAEVKVYGAPFGHWMIMVGLYCVAYMISGLIVRFLIRAIRRIFRRKKVEPLSDSPLSEAHLIDAFETPLRLYAMVLMAMISAASIGLSAVVRHASMPIGITIAWIAIGLFLWGVADLIVSNFTKRMAAKGRYNMTSSLAFVRRGVKFVLFIIVFIFILDSFGIDVTAGLAALGIGGIALALGAQKTLENFIGSLSIIIDQPVYVGDFCKIGDTTGTVEDIGMRSTRLRTNDRTLVTIPNGDLSTQRIENFARRNRFLLNRKMVLRYDATSDQIRDFMARADQVIKAQPKILQEGVILRLLGFSDSGYLVEIWCNVLTSDGNEFFNVQADVTLGIIDAARDAGVYFAIPSQTFLPAVDQTGPARKPE